MRYDVLRERHMNTVGEVVVLQHAESESLGTIADALRARGLSVRTVRGDLGNSIPQSLGAAVGLIVMGGPMGVYDHARYPFLSDEIRLIQAAVQAGKPVLGVCLGSQLLAAALGAQVRKGPRKEIGWYPVHLDAPNDPLLENVPLQFDAFHWHGDVFDLPSGAVKLAHSNLTACQGFRYANAYGILFHMEVTEASIAGMSAAFPEELAEAEVNLDRLTRDTERYLPQLRSIGALTFGRWVASLGVSASGA
jgi:GMP synthase (glutamine-hydrolysing)